MIRPPEPGNAPILPKTEAGLAVMYAIDGILSDDDMPCGFDYDNAAQAALSAEYDRLASEPAR